MSKATGKAGVKGTTGRRESKGKAAPVAKESWQARLSRENHAAWARGYKLASQEAAMAGSLIGGPTEMFLVRRLNEWNNAATLFEADPTGCPPRVNCDGKYECEPGAELVMTSGTNPWVQDQLEATLHILDRLAKIYDESGTKAGCYRGQLPMPNVCNAAAAILRDKSVRFVELLRRAVLRDDAAPVLPAGVETPNPNQVRMSMDPSLAEATGLRVRIPGLPHLQAELEECVNPGDWREGRTLLVITVSPEQAAAIGLLLCKSTVKEREDLKAAGYSLPWERGTGRAAVATPPHGAAETLGAVRIRVEGNTVADHAAGLLTEVTLFRERLEALAAEADPETADDLRKMDEYLGEVRCTLSDMVLNVVGDSAAA